MSRRIALPRESLQNLVERANGYRASARPHSVEPARRLLTPELTEDERYCRDLTRREAANFYWGFLALPRHQRLAIYALYSFAREVDDDVDLAATGNGEALPEYDGAGLLAQGFQHHRERVRRCYMSSADDPVMRVLVEVVDRYRIPRQELEALIAGVEMDLAVTRYGNWEDLRRYCNLVASSVGRMCVRIFGFTDPVALEYADELGVAMQLCNILRDVREDYAMGRVYLPQEELRAFDVPEVALSSGEPGAGWEPLMRFQIERAKGLFASGLRVTEAIPRRATACVLTMAGIYQALVTEMERDPYLPLTQRASLTSKKKLSVMLRSWLYAV